MDRDTALLHVLTIARQLAEPVTWEDPDDLREDLRRALRDYDDAPALPPLRARRDSDEEEEG